MESLTIMSQAPGPLVRALFFALKNLLVVLVNPLVVSVPWGLAFFFYRNRVNW